MKPVTNVTRYACDRVSGRSVLYAGCSDDFGGLHRNAAALLAVAKSFVGIDNKPAITAARPDVQVRVVDLNAPVSSEAWRGLSPDVIVFTEILEHLSNPVGVLSTLRQAFPGAGLLISVPNATSFGRVVSVALSRHGHLKYDGPEHIYAFNRSCLEHLLARSGIERPTFLPYVHAKWLVPLIAFRPNLCSGWIAEATL